MESYLDVQHLTKSFGEKVLFDDMSFSVSEGQKVGLVARNGTGKSTLLSILHGDEGYDAGQIVYRNDIRVGYLEQTPHFNPTDTVLDACFNHEGNPEKVLRAKQVLTQLRIEDLEQKVGELSGGQLKRVALANVLLLEPDFLILDEPTNHLDLEMIEWLEGYLRRGNKTLLMVTHDRYFLDEVCNLILEIDDETIYTYRGNYSYYLEKRQERIDNARAEIARANNLYRKELDWMRRQPQARGHKARYREEAFYDLEAKAKRRIEERQMCLKSSSIYIGSKIFECQYVSKAFERADGTQKVILKDFYYNFARFEKMGIVGKNGTGKSTFVKMLLGKVEPDGGRFDIGDTVRFGYFSQEGLQFREDQKVHGLDAQSQLPRARRADQRPRYSDAPGAGGVFAGLPRLRDRDLPRPLLHRQGGGPSTGLPWRGRHSGLSRQLHAVSRLPEAQEQGGGRPAPGGEEAEARTGRLPQRDAPEDDLQGEDGV